MEAIAIRASSLPELFDCPARWEAKHINHLRMPRSAAAQLGTAIHAGTGTYDQSVLSHQGLTIDDAAGVLVDAIYKPEEDVAWDDDLKPALAESIGLSLHRKYCEEIAPTQTYAGVEITCDSLTVSDIGITLTGTTDRVRIEDGKYGISDIKTGATAVGADGTVKTQKHGLQMAVYELLASAALGVPITEPARIIGMQTGKTPKAQRIGLGDIDSPREILLGDGDRPGMLEYASKIVHGGLFHGNPSSMLCSAKFCPVFKTCRFK